MLKTRANRLGMALTRPFLLAVVARCLNTLHLSISSNRTLRGSRWITCAVWQCEARVGRGSRPDEARRSHSVLPFDILFEARPRLACVANDADSKLAHARPRARHRCTRLPKSGISGTGTPTTSRSSTRTSMISAHCWASRPWRAAVSQISSDGDSQADLMTAANVPEILILWSRDIRARAYASPSRACASRPRVMCVWKRSRRFHASHTARLCSLHAPRLHLLHRTSWPAGFHVLRCPLSSSSRTQADWIKCLLDRQEVFMYFGSFDLHGLSSGLAPSVRG
ncbi:hypothetical protein DFH06DRAFT_753459 [Mycena polygramma]|nr:hypothetical protein DFH06DRAFT_753459 [Mycena polygramma]